jgi:hypothetical protein
MKTGVFKRRGAKMARYVLYSSVDRVKVKKVFGRT